MEGDLLTWVFMIGGVLLIFLEAVVPGGIAFLLGLSGLGVGVIRYFGFLDDPLTAVVVWLLSSTVMTLAIRPFINKYFNTLIIKNIIELSKPELPNDYLMVYLYFPLNIAKLRERIDISDEEYERWIDFYNENRDNKFFKLIEVI